MRRGLKPTDAELAVLRVLWERGASTVREVHDAMAGERRVGYTTTLKTLQVMTEKGLTVREDLRGQHLYSARHAEAETQRHLLADLLDRAFGGSTSKLVIQVLTARPASEDDLREIRRMLASTAPPAKSARKKPGGRS
jgi:predicted transcriptional regulator